MARKKRKKRDPSGARQSAKSGGGGYSAGELFIAILGGALVVLFLGIIVTAILGD